MSKIDDIFKDNLDQQGLEYSDAHWQEMETLLDSQKVGFWAKYNWIFSGLGLLLIVGCIGYFLGVRNQSSSIDLSGDYSGVVKRIDNNKIQNNQVNLDCLTVDDSITSTFVFDPSQLELPQFMFPINMNDMIGCAGVIDYSSPFGLGTNYFPLNNGFSPQYQVDEKVELTSIRDVILTSKQESKSTTISKLPNPKQKLDISISPFVGLNLYKRTSQFDGLNKLKEQEKPLNAFSYGLNVEVRKNNWAIKSGLEMLKIQEQTNYLSTETDWLFDTSYHLIKRNYQDLENGDFAALISERIDSTGTDKEVIECPNCVANFIYINIPLALQYQIQKNRLIYFGEAGVNIGFLKSAKGKYSNVEQVVDSTGTKYLSNVMDLSSQSFIAKQLLQISGSVGVKYKLSSKLNVWGSYGYSKSIGSMFTTYEQKAQLQNLKIGLQLKLR